MYALKALNECEVIIGYKTYIELVGSIVQGKEIISSGMTKEMERARLSIEHACKGKSVCLISSGDPGVYGMAGPVLQLLKDDAVHSIDIEIIPAVSAASACASLLGAPLMHDFAVISLSDLLTDLKIIEKRIRLAADGDYIIVLYNPKSSKRIKPLTKAWDILMQYRSPHTPVGIVRNAYRESEVVEIVTLKDMLKSDSIDMYTTIIIGNSETYVKDGYMITPRWYNFDR